MRFYQLILVLSALDGTLSLGKLPGVALLSCCLDGVLSPDSDSYAFSILREQKMPHTNVLFSPLKSASSNHKFYQCEAVKEDSTHKMNVQLETVLLGDTPQQLSLQVSDRFIEAVNESVIICRKDIANFLEDEHYLDKIYKCDDFQLDLIIPANIPRKSSRKLRSVRTKSRFSKSGLKDTKGSHKTKKTPIDEIECSSGKLPANFKLDVSLTILGQVCTVVNDEYRYEVGRIYLINSTGGLDCLPCCIDYYWNNVTKRCEPCKPGTIQPVPSFWDTCEAVSGHVQYDDEPIAPPSKNNPHYPSTAPGTVHKPEPVLKPPAVAPANLSLVEIGIDFAKLEWSEVPKTETQPVAKYKIILTCSKWEKSRIIETRDSDPKIALLNLDPGSRCNVKVLAANSHGFGPQSKTVKFNTLHELKAPRGLQYSHNEEHVMITWRPRKWEKDLDIVVKFWEIGHSPSTMNRTTECKPNCTVNITLPEYGSYHFEVFYSSLNKNGPKSSFQVILHQAEVDGKGFGTVLPLGWMIFVIALAVISCAAFFVYCCYLRCWSSSA